MIDANKQMLSSKQIKKIQKASKSIQRLLALGLPHITAEAGAIIVDLEV